MQPSSWQDPPWKSHNLHFLESRTHHSAHSTVVLVDNCPGMPAHFTCNYFAILGDNIAHSAISTVVVTGTAVWVNPVTITGTLEHCLTLNKHKG